jgi:CRISPR/Cas system-associated exonuclease Cas4 (RecB family)
MCAVQREKEVEAIKETTRSIMQETRRKLELLESRINCKVYEKCGSTFEKVESRLMQVLREDLMFLGIPPIFEHPEDATKSDTGVGVVVRALQQTAKKPPGVSPIKAKVSTPVSIQYLEEASRMNILLDDEEKSIAEAPISSAPIVDGKPQVVTYSQQSPLLSPPQESALRDEVATPFESPAKPSSLLSSPTPIEIKDLSETIPQKSSRMSSVANLDAPNWAENSSHRSAGV